MDINVNENPEFKAAISEVESIEQAAQAVSITTSDEYQAAGEELKRIKAAAKKLDEVRKSITRPIDAAKQAVMDLFRGPEQRLAQAEEAHKTGMLAYQRAEEEKRREAQRKADEEARRAREAAEKKARDEREKAEAARRDAERLAAEGKAEEAAKAQKKAEAADARAEQRDQTAQTIVAPVVAATPTKVAGVSTREVWDAEVTDFLALVRAVADGKASPELLAANLTEIRKRARALKAEFQVPGIRTFPEQQMAARAGA